MTYTRSRKSSYSTFASKGNTTADFIGFDPSSLMDLGQQGMNYLSSHAPHLNMPNMPHVDVDAMRQGAGQAFNAVRNNAQQYAGQAGDMFGNAVQQGRQALSGVPDMLSGAGAGLAQRGQQAVDAAQTLSPQAKNAALAAGVTGTGVVGLLAGLRGKKAPVEAAAAAPAAVGRPGLRRAGKYAAIAGGVGLAGLGAKAGYDALNRSDMAMRTNALASFTSDPRNLAKFNSYR